MRHVIKTEENATMTTSHNDFRFEGKKKAGSLHARLLRRVGADPGALAADAAETHAVKRLET